MKKVELHEGAVTEHKKKISVNQKSIETPLNADANCAEPISELSNRFLNEGN
ncbi:hypothetical protein [Bacillus sp. CHD6a]|uniref:hypothetical protein n=1 Tax=Bacillus sp. CHD6a TaxID=1643452 RepID=UPI000AB92E5F|nr:hypothetical protein [Bacillus sp. CHD6a]